MLLRQQFRKFHQLLEGTLAGVALDQLHAVPPGTANPAGAFGYAGTDRFPRFGLPPSTNRPVRVWCVEHSVGHLGPDP